MTDERSRPMRYVSSRNGPLEFNGTDGRAFSTNAALR